MNFYEDINDCFYSTNSKLLHNAITLEVGNKKYHFEFILNNNEAIIHTDSMDYIQEAVDYYHKRNPYISTYYTQNHTFYKAYDNVFCFKLPIYCIQPSKFFLCEKRINEIEEAMDLDSIHLPVTIIEDEYVLIDGHHRLYTLQKNDYKMVEVFLSTPSPNLHDFVYLAKENNLNSINKLGILSEEEYQKCWIDFISQFEQYNE